MSINVRKLDETIYSDYQSMITNKLINSREMIIWFRSNEEFDTSKYFWCNETMSDKLGLKRNSDGLILTKDYYDLFVMDEEGLNFIDELKRVSKVVRGNLNNETGAYFVKLKNNVDGQIVYLHFILEVFERYPNGDIKTWGGNGIDVTNDYLEETASYLIQRVGATEYNIVTCKLSKGNQQVVLNPIESKFFLMLVEASGELVSYEMMMEYMGYHSVGAVKEFAKVYMHRLRKKIEFIEGNGIEIVSHYAKGYSLYEKIKTF